MKFMVLVLFLPAVLLAAGVIETFDAPDTGITALAWGNGSLWAVDGTTQYVYQIDPANGSVLSSFYAMDQTAAFNPVPGGLTFGDGTIYLAMYSGSSYARMYRYNEAGTFLSDFDLYC
jgi:hypothetical protein